METFTSSRGIRLEEMDDDELESRRTMMELDPPEHTRLRRLVNRGFTRRTVESYEDAIRALAAEVLDEALTADAFDFVTEVAARLPMRMLGRLLGTSDEDGHQLVEWGDAFLGNSDPEFTTHVVDTADTEEFRLMPFRSPAAVEVFEYAERQAAERRAAERRGVPPHRRDHPAAGPHPRRRAAQRPRVQELLPAADRGRKRHHPLHHDPRAANDDAASRALAGLASRSLPHPHRGGGGPAHQRSDHALPPHRHPGPSPSAEREIAAGDKVVMWFCSANHDSDGFDDPWRFDLARDPNDHMAFGRNGPHLCLGAWLARMEARLVYEELLKRIDRLEPDGEPQYLRSNFIAGIKHLPVRVVA